MSETTEIVDSFIEIILSIEQDFHQEIQIHHRIVNNEVETEKKRM